MPRYRRAEAGDQRRGKLRTGNTRILEVRTSTEAANRITNGTYVLGVDLHLLFMAGVSVVTGCGTRGRQPVRVGTRGTRQPILRWRALCTRCVLLLIWRERNDRRRGQHRT